MVALRKPKAAPLGVTADFDPSADVLYLTLNSPRADEVADQLGDVLLRVGIDDDQPSGVTVLGYRADGWPRRSVELAAIAATHLGIDTGSILKAIDSATQS